MACKTVRQKGWKWLFGESFDTGNVTVNSVCPSKKHYVSCIFFGGGRYCIFKTIGFKGNAESHYENKYIF